MPSYTDADRFSGPADHQVDPKVLRRVRALLAKAEATPYAEEAAAFTAKANTLMTEHAISQILAESDGASSDTIETLVVPIEAPYTREKFHILSAVANTNRCRAVLGLHENALAELDPNTRLTSAKGEYCVVLGTRPDLEIVNLLFTSLLLQAVHTMLAHGSVVDGAGRNRTKSFRHSFLLGFASTVAQRLHEANTQATDAAVATQENPAAGTAALVPRLQQRADAVDTRLHDLFPATRTISSTVSNRAGLRAGHNAGATADIGHTPVPDRSHPSIS